ncbi:hypothetical protein LX97_00764 [Nonlabens dokdonensis]|uniref:Cell wall surface anchor family protein n=2 Tax=Nonlabens dokdonensis TaxID=328515 RepID=L7W7G1_NONDD|nr:hypothetical protein [Nonlabens dokdonensis]AGC76089.1 cell wall surface anchor family protein [Nonlabens dokdonensis DSW-6]PZX43760.1 hypothetical protein LX97_00764 [Nonlabens dokdonensis]
MKLRVTLLLLMMTGIALGQVGINTQNPDPSSMLDIMSDDKGFLAPRMDSTSRLDITDPATGLLVYDTTLEAFQYFDGSEWGYLARTQKRSNYKLVKSIADLSDELTAGGNTKYLLNTDFLYEINGQIVVDFPIDLNGAYIEGLDSTEDVLINNSSGSLFEGSKGGGLRNLTLSGSIPSGTKKQLFDISGSSGELLLINNTILTNASKIGNLEGLGTVFFSTTQYLLNDDGFTIENIDNFFVSNIFWTASNTGTFLELNGSFNNLQMNGGRIEAGSSETGIDVSSNPTIVNDATLAQLSFVGDGNSVDGYTAGSYTGFNFTNDWNVNCSGIPFEADQVATGNIFYGGDLTTGYLQTITSGAPVQIKSATDFVATDLFRFRAEDDDNDLIYGGKKRRNVEVNVSLSVRVTSGAGNFYAFAIAKNGSIVLETNSVVQIANDAQIQNIALNGVLTLEPDDKVEIFVDRLTGSGTNSLIVFSENISVR